MNNDIKNLQAKAKAIEIALDDLKERREEGQIEEARYQALTITYRTKLIAIKNEFDVMQKHTIDESSEGIDDLSSKLKNIDGKLGEMISSQKLILGRVDEGAKLMTAIMGKLDQNQLETTKLIMDAIETKDILEDQIQDILAAEEQALNEIKKFKCNDRNPLTSAEIEQLSGIIDDPKIDASQKLKFTIPIIPLILSYEGELNLATGLNLRSAWKSIISKLK
jgi:hypothetical protein